MQLRIIWEETLYVELNEASMEKVIITYNFFPDTLSPFSMLIRE